MVRSEDRLSGLLVRPPRIVLLFPDYHEKPARGGSQDLGHGSLPWSNLTRFLLGCESSGRKVANELEKWFFGFEERIERNFFFCSTFISYYFIFICSTEPNLFFFSYAVERDIKDMYHFWIDAGFEYIWLTNDFRFQIRTDEGLKKAKSGPDGASRISEMSSINQKTRSSSKDGGTDLGSVEDPTICPPFFFSSFWSIAAATINLTFRNIQFSHWIARETREEEEESLTGYCCVLSTRIVDRNFGFNLKTMDEAYSKEPKMEDNARNS